MTKTAFRSPPSTRARPPRSPSSSSTGSRPLAAEFTPIEDDVAFGQRLAAARICGWRGITEDFTPDLALRLCQSNPEVSAQVVEASNTLSNFMKVSPPTL
jgi:hypothetical protein